MPFIDTIRDWFSGEKPSNKTIPVSAALAIAAPVVIAEPATARPLAAESAPPKVAPVKKVSPPAAPQVSSPAAVAEDNILTQALDEDALQSLQNANTMEERSNILLSHPFFTEGAGKAKQGFDAKMMVEVLKHLNDVYSSLGYQMRHCSRHGTECL